MCTPAKARDLATELEGLRVLVLAEEPLSGNEMLQGSLMPGWLFRIISFREDDIEWAKAVKGRVGDALNSAGASG